MNVNMNKICLEEKTKQCLTNKQISDLASVPLATINNYFSKDAVASDGTTGTFETNYKVCRALGISIDAPCGIVDPRMGQEEIARIKDYYEGKLNDNVHIIELHTQQAGHQDEIIARQDKTIEIQEARIKSQEKAIFWLRCLIAMFATLFLVFVAV